MNPHGTGRAHRRWGGARGLLVVGLVLAVAAIAFVFLRPGRPEDRLLRTLRTETDFNARLSAAQNLAELGARDRILEALSDQSPKVRVPMIQKLSFWKDPSAVDRLIAALGDPEASARKSAAFTLGRMKAAPAVPPLVEAMSDPDPGLRKVFGDALGEITGENLGSDQARWKAWDAARGAPGDSRPTPAAEDKGLRKN